MIIKEARIGSFAGIENKVIKFHRGINVIYGENEAGKTTIHTFIRGMLFYATPLGCLWWFAELKYAGAAFFFCLAILIYGMFTLPFINIYGSFVKDDEEQVVKDEVGPIKSCVGLFAAVLGPVLGIWLFISSMPYWDLKERREVEENQKVYITPHENCYHSTKDCYTIRGHKIKEIPLYKAKKKGRRPCDICY